MQPASRHLTTFGLVLLAVGASHATEPSRMAARLGETFVIEQPTSEQLDLPDRFQRLVADRKVIDLFQARHHQVEPAEDPSPIVQRMIRRPTKDGVLLLEPTLPSATAAFRAGFTNKFLPLRGFRAPILEESEAWLPLVRQNVTDDPRFRAAATLINQRLARDGLLPTLSQALEILGPQQFTTNGIAGLWKLDAIGFPEDLLACFSQNDHSGLQDASIEVVKDVAHRLLNGAPASSLKPELESLPFHFPADWAGFEVASESGINELGTLRLQVGGGYVDGIVPGASIDVIRQLVTGLPGINFIATVPSELSGTIENWATATLPLRRSDQLTLISEPSLVEAWAQDNGKAGTTQDPITGIRRLATLAPRYASREEGLSAFLPSESFLMDGLNASGHRVTRFPLLFQGGNLMPVKEPGTGRRLLLIGEGVIHRNVALGLTDQQVLEAFRLGFGVDECVRIPGVSFHLDFDVCVREVKGELVVFVNDSTAAVRVILGLGIDVLRRHDLIDDAKALTLHYDLAGGRSPLVLQFLTAFLNAEREADGKFGADVAAMFRTARLDSAEGNLQVFLQALDLLASSALRENDDPGPDPERHNYLLALRRMENAQLAQVAAWRSRGWKVIPVPSMPNLYSSVNYLNGIQHRDGYIMPAYGGFYAPLDAAAEKVFRDAMEPGAAILPIQCAELQRHQGAVHCAAAAYPLIPTSVTSR